MRQNKYNTYLKVYCLIELCLSIVLVILGIFLLPEIVFVFIIGLFIFIDLLVNCINRISKK